MINIGPCWLRSLESHDCRGPTSRDNPGSCQVPVAIARALSGSRVCYLLPAAVVDVGLAFASRFSSDFVQTKASA